MSAQSSTATRRSNEENAARIEELHADGVDKELAFPKAVLALFHFPVPSRPAPRPPSPHGGTPDRCSRHRRAAPLPRDVSAQPGSGAVMRNAL
jgi:hypothetical protein